MTAPSPIADPHTRITYLDVRLEPSADFRHGPPAGHTAFTFLFEGLTRLGESELAEISLAVLNESGEVAVTAGKEGARFLLVAGQPLGEPIVQQGPFVMNSRAEIEQAFADYRNGNLVQHRANFREM